MFIKKRWLSTEMVVHGDVIDMTKVSGFLYVENCKIIGLVTYITHEKICEIVSLDSLHEGKGIGTNLLYKVIAYAKNNMYKKIVVITTNDNIKAIRFYQRKGFDMTRLFHNSLDLSRKLKPSIPLIGENDIPLLHEIEFTMLLNTI